MNKAQHDKMVSLVAVRRILALHKSLKSAHNPPFTGLTQEADRLMREVEPAADRGIDSLVYELPQGG